MGHIQQVRMQRARQRYREEMFPDDKARSFYVDPSGNVIGFTIERADGIVISYNGMTGRFEPFTIYPGDVVINTPPYVYRDGKIIDPEALNTKIEYLYRDADNYKVFNECVIEGLLSEEQKKQILGCRIDGEWFIPHMVGLPGNQFGSWDPESDHPLFELYEHSFEATRLSPTVDVKATDLVTAFDLCNKSNWNESRMKSVSLSERITSAEEKRAKAGIQQRRYDTKKTRR